MKERFKVIAISLIIFFGTAFAIMTFNEDVAAEDMFTKIYQIVYDNSMQSNGILEFFYAVGAAVGIVVFYNHFGSKNITRDPTPLEVKMWQYDEDITQYQDACHGQQKNNKQQESGG